MKRARAIVPNQLRDRIARAGLRINEVARHMRLTRAAIHRYMDGSRQPAVAAAIKLAALLRCRVEDIWPGSMP